jgi:hypothetical protein
MANPPAPIEVKRKRGTLRADRMPGGKTELAAVPALPRTDADLSPLEAFDKVMQMGSLWFAATDAPSLALLRCLFEEREELTSGGYDRAQLRALDKQITELLSVCGMNPAARSRLGLAEVRAKSKLEEMRDRQARKQEMAAKVANRPDRSGDR